METKTDWKAAIHYAKLQQVASSVAPSGGYDPAHIGQIAALGYKFVQPIYGYELASEINPHAGEVVTFGFLAISDSKELVVAIRGTGTIFEWAHDSQFLMVPCPIKGGHGYTEDGFTCVYRSLSIGKVKESPSPLASICHFLDTGEAKSVTICGHSLGAALATLLTMDVAQNSSCHTPGAYLFASPRVGDHIFTHAYNTLVTASHRIVNRFDLVPKLPPILPLPYDHVDTRFELVPPSNTIRPDLGCMHHLTTYLWLMSQNIGSGGYPLDEDCRFSAGALEV